MLHAIGQKNSRLYRRYLLDQNDPSDERIGKEDEVTSAIIGPMAFMAPADVYRFWKKFLLTNAGIEAKDFLLDPSPLNVNVVLWSSRRTYAVGTLRIEPDVYIEFEWQNGEKRIFLIEIKWGDKKSDTQLQKHWDDFLEDGERGKTWQIFIGRKHGFNFGKADAFKHCRLTVATWNDFRKALAFFVPESGHGLPCWAKLADSLLDKTGVSSFTGFGAMKMRCELPVERYVCVFWNPSN